MNAFDRHSGICAPIRIDNVDTDQIIPSREMKHVSKHGLGEGLFANWRYRYEGHTRTGANEEFVLNQPAYAGATILLSGRNFGCGSSREHAVWALHDFGIKVIIAESFGRIFMNNCARNGLLAIELPAAEIDRLQQQTNASPQTRTVLVDLTECRVHAPDGDVFEFTVSESDRHMLLSGLDYIDYTLKFASDIERFVVADRRRRPWAYL